MSSVAIARSLTREVGEMLAPGGGWKEQVRAVYRALSDRKSSPHLDGLTWNRVKSWFFSECRRVDFHEVTALQELRAFEEARRARQKLAATANRLAALLETEEKALDSEERRELGRLAGALDRAGIKADGASL